MLKKNDQFGANRRKPVKGQLWVAPTVEEARFAMPKGHQALVSSTEILPEAEIALSEDRAADASDNAVEEAISCVPKGQEKPASSTAPEKSDRPESVRKGRKAVVTPRSKGATRAPPVKGQRVHAPLLPNSELPEAIFGMPKGQASHASGSSDKGATIRKPTKGQASVAPLSPIIDAIQEQWRRRQAWHRAEKSLTLAAKALCRRFCAGDKAAARLLYEAAMKLRKSTVVVSKPDLLVTQALFAMMPILTARDHLETSRETLEDRMLPLVKQLPVAGWWLAINGCGLLGLAGIIGEAGDLSKYPKHGHLWKRLGLAVMPDGTRQRRVKGKEAREHGYSPARRSVIWNVGNALFKAQSEKPEGKVTAKGKQRAAAPAGEYRLIYDARKAYELLHLPEEKGRAGHAHKRAQRYMEKKLIRRLWKAWRQA